MCKTGHRFAYYEGCGDIILQTPPSPSVNARLEPACWAKQAYVFDKLRENILGRYLRDRATLVTILRCKPSDIPADLQALLIAPPPTSALTKKELAGLFGPDKACQGPLQVKDLKGKCGLPGCNAVKLREAIARARVLVKAQKRAAITNADEEAEGPSDEMVSDEMIAHNDDCGNGSDIIIVEAPASDQDADDAMDVDTDGDDDADEEASEYAPSEPEVTQDITPAAPAIDNGNTGGLMVSMNDYSESTLREAYNDSRWSGSTGHAVAQDWLIAGE